MFKLPGKDQKKITSFKKSEGLDERFEKGMLKKDWEESWERRRMFIFLI